MYFLWVFVCDVSSVFLLFLAASGLSCGTWGLRCITWGLSAVHGLSSCCTGSGVAGSIVAAFRLSCSVAHVPKGLALALKPCLPLRNRKRELKQGATLLGTSKQCQEGELGFCWASLALLQAPSLRRCSQRRLAGLLPGEGLRTRIIRHMLLPGCNQPASRDTLGPQV